MNQNQAVKTETGIDLTTYVTDRDAGLVKITRPVQTSENYVYMRARHEARVVAGVPELVEIEPVLLNINRKSLADVEEQLQMQEAHIATIRAAIAAIEQDMNAA